jgi:lipoate-protein ligase A
VAPVLAAGIVTPFEFVEFAESPRTFHERELPDTSTPQVWWNRLTEPALVLGSTQRRENVVDDAACAAAGIDVIRRRSGGGAVLLVPDEVVWFDVVVPTGAIAGLGDDVHAPMLWLGDRLVQLLAPLIDGETTVRGPGMVSTPWSSLICFDGFGPGEVLVDGRKLVGISQRRTRAVARLQCCWYRSYDPERLVELLSVDIRPAVTDLASVATLDTIDVALVLSDLARSL